MGFSAKTAYGLVALIDLAEAYASGTLVQTGEISRRHGAPECCSPACAKPGC